jgi:periplasmic divalent cation tolerance protein
MRADEEQVCVVLCTVPNEEVATAVVRAALQGRAAACVNVLPGVRSHYWWEGRLQADTEQLLIIKTTRARYPALQAAVREAHPYDVPELIVLDTVDGWPPYLAWVAQEARPQKDA